MGKADIPFLSASQLAELIKNRTVSPVEAVETYLERIDKLDSKLYAYLTVCQDEALQAARESEQALAKGEYRGPLHGVPFAVKDQLNTAGIRTTSGTPVFQRFRARRRCHRGSQAEVGRSHPAGQAQHDRVRHHRPVPRFPHSTQPLGSRAVYRWFQQRLGRCHCRFFVRHIPG